MKMFVLVMLSVIGLLCVVPQGAFAAKREKALVVVSFGTTFTETRELDLAATEKALAAAFPDRDFRRAFTAKIVRQRLWENEGMKVDDLAAVLERLHLEGYKDILVQPTHLTPGEEIAKKVIPTINTYKGKFSKLYLGKPLLTDERDFALAARALETTMPNFTKGEVIVFMGHGSPNQHNPAYGFLQDSFRQLGIPAIIGVVEDTDRPNYADMLARLKQSGARKVVLLPLMLVAGDHANNDLAGKEEDSWASMLGKEGFAVRYELNGMGRNIAIQNIYVLHALAALTEQ